MTEAVDMDRVFHALANPTRRSILDIVRNDPGCCVNDVSSSFETSRIAVMKHLRVLEDAGLLTTRKQGRTRELFFNIVPIQMIYDRWSGEYSSYWAQGLTGLKYRVETRKEEPT